MKLPRVSRKSWIALGLFVVLVAVLMMTTRSREGMENPPVADLVARVQAIKAKIQPSGLPENEKIEQEALPLFFLAFAKDSVPTTDPAVLAAFESKNFTALKGLKVVDASEEVLGELLGKLQGRNPNPSPFFTTLGGWTDIIVDIANGPSGSGPNSLTQAQKDAIVTHAKRVFTVAQPTPQVPSPSTPSSSANYSATCNKCSVINNQITCACDVLPK